MVVFTPRARKEKRKTSKCKRDVACPLSFLSPCCSGGQSFVEFYATMFFVFFVMGAALRWMTAPHNILYVAFCFRLAATVLYGVTPNNMRGTMALNTRLSQAAKWQANEMWQTERSALIPAQQVAGVWENASRASTAQTGHCTHRTSSLSPVF
ncbi:hypothetical protein SKAU_G00100570 [Synaphobranchus kaupii]|uniref:Uncharacterized protein n=1 Tax=Synaphobranchus kaupii TaxID=118154 RepID=A0A9Q1FY58_SYNKA|nr:hypothetical protein SKAU_G00100570 [Synaphobranchus kaupii]